MTSWRKEINKCFEMTGDDWGNVIECTLSQEELDKRFKERGKIFTMWTERYVYFPAEYDGHMWAAYVSRNPNGESTGPIGSG